VTPTGGDKWSPAAVGFWPSAPSVSLGPDGTIYVGKEEGTVDLFNPADGSFRNEAAASDEITATPIIDGAGKIYVGDESGKFFAFNADMSLFWSKDPIGAGRCDSAAALTADGKLWVVTSDGWLSALNATTGSRLLQKPIGLSGTANVSSPIVGSDGWVFVVAGTTICAIEGYGTGSKLASDFWPSFRNNIRHAADVRYNRWTESTVTVGGTTITAITPFSSGNESKAFGVNDLGKVTGYANGNLGGTFATSAFSYSPMTPIGFNTGRGTYSFGYSIAVNGDIIGHSGPSVFVGFWYNAASVTSVSLTPQAPYGGSQVYGISQDGTRFVGNSYAGGADRATKWTTTATAGADFGSLSVSGTSYASGVNNNGLVVGKSVNSSGVMRAYASSFDSGIVAGDDLGSQAGATGDSWATAVNGFNQIAGMTKITSGLHRPFYKNGKADAVWHTAIMPSAINGDSAYALAINERGQMVGQANLTGSSSTHAFIWCPGSSVFSVKDLNDFLNTTQQSQWVLQQATGITDSGKIVGFGTFNGAVTAFLLTPN